MDTSYQYIRQLYLEKLTETISEEDDALLQKLLHKDDEARSIWKLLEEENRDLNADVVLARIDPENELEEFRKRIRNQEEPVMRHLWWRWSAAAVILVGLGAGYFFRGNLSPLSADRSDSGKQGPGQTNGVKLILGDGKSIVFSKEKAQKFSVEGIQLENSGNQLLYDGNKEQSTLFNKLVVPAKEDYAITLSDGTRVSLNSETTLHFPFHFTGGTREVYIEGEAYLEVAKDSKRPFIVHTPLTNIHVTGTSFNVNTYEEGTVRTSLVEGKVSVRAADKKPLDLAPGLEVTYAKRDGFTTKPFDPDEVLSWREGTFYFHNRPLGELTGLISRWFGVRVVFEKKELAEHTVSGLLEKGHLTEFLNDLGKTSGINYSMKDTVLYLK